MSAVLHEGHPHRDAVGARIGMWLFLFTELILFAGLFLTYAVFRLRYASDFHYASGGLNVVVGAVNTLILLTSSLTMVLAVAALERGGRRLSAFFLSATLLLGLAFLVNKYFEWSHKIHLGLYPNSPALAMKPPGEGIFYGLYYSMTGLHGLHVVAGMGILAWMLGAVARRPRRRFKIASARIGRVEVTGSDGGTLLDASADPEADTAGAEVAIVYEHNEAVTEGRLVKLENAGLYWHLVDIVWIFLFPLFYLIS